MLVYLFFCFRLHIRIIIRFSFHVSLVSFHLEQVLNVCLLDKAFWRSIGQLFCRLFLIWGLAYVSSWLDSGCIFLQWHQISDNVFFPGCQEAHGVGLSHYFCLHLLCGKNSCCCCLVTQMCPTLCDSTACSSPGSCVHGISQERILGWTAFSFSRGSSQSRGWASPALEADSLLLSHWRSPS